MSESIALELLGTAYGLAVLGASVLAARAASKAKVRRNLVRRETQLSDGSLLTRVFDQLGLKVQSGDAGGAWGVREKIEFQLFDPEGNPWITFARSDQVDPFVIYYHDPNASQEGIDPQDRLSERDPAGVLGAIAQQYGYLKSLITLLQAGYQQKGELEIRGDGSKVLTLHKHDRENNEELTIRLVFSAQSGETQILTDSQRKDGTHGVCPDMDALLEVMQIEKYSKWTSPSALQAKQEAQRSPSKMEKNHVEYPVKMESKRAKGNSEG